jgi:hypothetical protein
LLTSDQGIACTLPESLTLLKRIPSGQILSDIFHISLFEKLKLHPIKMPVQALMDFSESSAFITPQQRVLLFLICTQSSEDDHHLWNK